MTLSKHSERTASKRSPASLFHAEAFAEDGYCEAFDAGGTSVRPHWQSLIATLDAIEPSRHHRCQERIARRRLEDGATYNPFDTPSGRGTPWALEMIPLPLDSADWTILGNGLRQRAHLLEKVLADVYGAQQLLHSGMLPAELVYANPHFLRACHGIVPAQGRHLTYYAADLYRGDDGRFRVLRDYADNPAGLGYALENRIVISRVFAELYRTTHIQRLAPFFQTFHNSLVHRCTLRRDDPDIVLLSPGPDNRIYFEQALLSRYLGYPLVEAEDLTVRNGKVFLKKLAGLEPVDIIFRHLTDDATDPFALRQKYFSGVAGLIQSCREQLVDIVNPIGSGFVDTPALACFLPALCRHLMGAELLLENHAAWWCGQPDARDHVLSHLEALSVLDAMERNTPVPDPQKVREAILSAPYRYMASAAVCPSTVPAWGTAGVHSRPVLFRLFACATAEGFTILPGGLALTATHATTLLEGIPERLQSKDIWVLSDQPVVPFSMIHQLRLVSEFKRGSDLPSRVADHLLWLGRYLERVEGVVRLLRMVFRRLSGEAGLQDIPELPFLLSLLRAENTIAPSSESGGTQLTYRELMTQLQAALFEAEGPESVLAILHRVHEAGRRVRDRLSMDAWRVLNRLEGFADRSAEDPQDLLDDIQFTLSAFSGLAKEGVTRGLGWRFMDMGRRVERAIHQTRLIRIGLADIHTDALSTDALEALLEASDSLMTYRSRYRTSFQLAPVLDLLISDETNPKSLIFQCDQINAHVEQLPRQEERRFVTADERMALEMLTTVRLLDLASLPDSGPDQPYETLMGFLESMESKLTDFARQISAHYLSRVPATSHFSQGHSATIP